MFKLPNITAGAGPAPTGAAMPTHVYKVSSGGRDWMTVGTYTPGTPKVLGTFKATAGVPHSQWLVDQGAFYASKDFYDPVKQRRINIGWVSTCPVLVYLHAETGKHPKKRKKRKKEGHRK